MTSGINQDQEYQRAQRAYMQGNYEEAATLVDRLVQEFPDDPSSRLLQGHIYCVLQQYDLAREQYNTVLGLTQDPEFVDFANRGLESVSEYETEPPVNPEVESNPDGLDTSSNPNPPQWSEYLATHHEAEASPSDLNPPEWSEYLTTHHQSEELGTLEGFDPNSFDFSYFDQEGGLEQPYGEHGAEPASGEPSSTGNQPQNAFTDPFAANQSASGNNVADADEKYRSSQIFSDAPLHDVPASSTDGTHEQWSNEVSSEDARVAGSGDTLDSNQNIFEDFSDYNSNSFRNSDRQPAATEFHPSFEVGQPPSAEIGQSIPNRQATSEDETLLMAEESLHDSPYDSLGHSTSERFSQSGFGEPHSAFEAADEEIFSPSSQNDFHGQDRFDFDGILGSEATHDFEQANHPGAGYPSNIDALDEFDEFDDIGNIPEFDLSEGHGNHPSSGAVGTHTSQRNGFVSGNDKIGAQDDILPGDRLGDSSEDELFSIIGSSEAVPVFTQGDGSRSEPSPNVEQGWLAFFENAPLPRKQLYTAGVVGAISAVVVAAVSFAAAILTPGPQRAAVRNTGWTMAAAAFIASGGASLILGRKTAKQIQRTTEDLRSQFDAVRAGNLNAQATVYAEDEFGQLAHEFNEMSRVILTTTSEAQRKAEEQEQAKEDLQRQVIRLLDDVEGAARGDLTVQAEVTADVLGAVADSFNLTIQNLREIVQQVKIAARQVNKGATDSEAFARALSSDALRQAEELAVTLNSVQVMTDSIQRVAEAAREAETVARSASATALKGGEAVERTVAGILEIRETVAETTRKVKRLAESSQEISKIVALISTIASRTNLLALNASIEAARAGESGRGFAVVADEVRQLADRAAKALKEIEQIVMQIQSETGSVMTAMEEGTQQVIEGTRLAEQAKHSLEDIIQVSNRIDTLVRSINADTVEQTETSRAVAQVMQSVELTAQETSQEAQRVSGSLQNLLGVARDLLNSVERFRVDTTEPR